MKKPKLKGAVFIVALISLGAGCRHDNSRRARDDIKIRVKLTRQFVRREMTDVPKDLHAMDNFKIEELEDLLVFLVIAPVVYCIEDGIAHCETTKGYIRPGGARGYRQRLYWGDNRVYIPARFKGRKVPVSVWFKGNYEGKYDFQIDLNLKRQKIRL